VGGLSWTVCTGIGRSGDDSSCTVADKIDYQLHSVFLIKVMVKGGSAVSETTCIFQCFHPKIGAEDKIGYAQQKCTITM
jgi:hypothetical protein